jgi:subtilisin family serine protease
MELKPSVFERKRIEAKKELEDRIGKDYLVYLKEYSDYVRKLGYEVEISPHFLRKFESFGRIKKVYKYIPAFSIRVDDRIKNEELKKYIKSPDIKEIVGGVEKNFVVGIPTPVYRAYRRKEANKLWNLEMVQAYEARRMTKGSGSVVAVIDTGADYEHYEIENRFLKYRKGYNVLNDSEDPMDDNGHGTHCSGTIAGESVGVAPSATLKAVKFLDAMGWGTLEDAITAVEWCIGERVDITSNSWGSGRYSEALKMVFDEAWNRGILSVAAAGNTGSKDYHYPSCYDSVMSVAAVDKNEKRAYFSTINEKNEISAPGVGVYSCIPGDKYDEYSGTSMATPHIAGGAAMIKSFYRARHEKIRKNLRKFAKPLGEGCPNEEYGYGLLQINKVLMWFR